MPKAQSFDQKFTKALEEYSKRYDVDALDSPNDIANLHNMIRNQIVIEEIQQKMHEQAEGGAVENIAVIQKLNIAFRDLTESNLALERALAIDRKTRQNQSQTNVATYIAALKVNAREFLEKQFIRVKCPSCKVLVARISPAHEHTAFNAGFQCSQCKKYITIDRTEKDVFFDIKDPDWRRKYPVEITQPKQKNVSLNYDNLEDDIVIENTEEDV